MRLFVCLQPFFPLELNHSAALYNLYRSSAAAAAASGGGVVGGGVADAACFSKLVQSAQLLGIKELAAVAEPESPLLHSTFGLPPAFAALDVGAHLIKPLAAVADSHSLANVATRNSELSPENVDASTTGEQVAIFVSCLQLTRC